MNPHASLVAQAATGPWRGQRPGLRWACLLLVLLAPRAGAAEAAPDPAQTDTLAVAGPRLARAAGAYTDTRHRFSLQLPEGWRLHPTPGDVQGMTFRRDVDQTFALLRVSVRAATADDTPERVLEQALSRLRGEIGFAAGSSVPTSVGLLPSRRASVTVHASGDARTVRAIDVIALVAFGHVHILHFEHLEKERARFGRDLERMTGSYQALVGKSRYAPLIATWERSDGGMRLVLGEDNHFRLAHLSGTYLADGGTLTLYLPEGQESYRYQQEGASLTLHSSNLEAPMRFARSGAARFADARTQGARERGTRALRAGDLAGRWRALERAGTEALVLQLAPSGSVTFGPLSGTWRFRRGLLTIRSIAGSQVTYTASLEGQHLVLGGGDLEQELRLEREGGP